jgi:hypothetical protein
MNAAIETMNYSFCHPGAAINKKQTNKLTTPNKTNHKQQHNQIQSKLKYIVLLYQQITKHYKTRQLQCNKMK